MKTIRSAQYPARQAVRAAVAWSLWLFALNLVWEFAQLPLYATTPNAEWPVLGYAVLHCTLGDAAIAFVAYLIAALLTRDPQWPTGRPLFGLAVLLVAGEAFTVWAEWYNVYVFRSWAYAAGMPTIRGIGVAPLAQWLVLPVLAVAILRHQYRHGVKSKVPSLTPHEPIAQEAAPIVSPQIAQFLRTRSRPSANCTRVKVTQKCRLILVTLTAHQRTRISCERRQITLQRPPARQPIPVQCTRRFARMGRVTAQFAV